MTTPDPVDVIAEALRDLADAAGRGEYPGEDGAARYIVGRLRDEYRADALCAIGVARSRRARQERILRDAVIHAHAAGVPITHIADAAGVTRQTVYRWIKDDA